MVAIRRRRASNAAPSNSAASNSAGTSAIGTASLAGGSEGMPIASHSSRMRVSCPATMVGTPAISETRDFLVQGLGLKVSDELDGIIAFLRCSPDHHNVALVDSPVPLLQHYSWECDDIDHVGHTASSLLRPDPSRHTWGLGRHFAGSNFYWYLRDPAGSYLELYSDLDQILDDDAWEETGRTPFDLDHVANSWGPDLPLEFVVPPDLDQLAAAWADR